MQITFPVIRRSVTRSGKCAVCGKKGTRTYRVEHTVNPFNRFEDGRIKEYDDVLADMRTELTVKQNEPFKHARCED